MMVRIFFLTFVSYIYGIFTWKSNLIQATFRYLFLFSNLYFILEALKNLQKIYVLIRESKNNEIKNDLLKKNNKKLFNKINKKMYYILKGKFLKSKSFEFYCKINYKFTKFPFTLLKVILHMTILIQFSYLMLLSNN